MKRLKRPLGPEATAEPTITPDTKCCVVASPFVCAVRFIVFLVFRPVCQAFPISSTVHFFTLAHLDKLNSAIVIPQAGLVYFFSTSEELCDTHPGSTTSPLDNKTWETQRRAAMANKILLVFIAFDVIFLFCAGVHLFVPVYTRMNIQDNMNVDNIASNLLLDHCPLTGTSRPGNAPFTPPSKSFFHF